MADMVKATLLGSLLLAGLGGCGGTTTTVVRTQTVVRTHTVTRPAAATTPNSARAVLPPASVGPAVDECSAQLSIGADGNAGPLTCANGKLNVLAWDYFAKDNPLVMSLGPDATPDQVLEAMCADLHTGSTDVIELSVYRLSALYYGWRFGIDPASEFPAGCS
jgi:hypothetical protein